MDSRMTHYHEQSPKDTPIGGCEAKAGIPTVNENPLQKAERQPLVSMEPDFADPTGACHMVYWQDCIAQLAVDIRERQNSATPCDFEFLKPQVVEYLFTVCVRLRLPSEVRYTAALILNIYMLRQLCALHDFVEKKAELTGQQKQREWENLETNVERQLPLRMLTAIQISSKFHSYHDSLSSRQVVNTLRKLGHPYTISAVDLSEQRVFKLIGFKMPDSPLEACEMTLKVMTYTLNRRGMMSVEKYDDVWQHVLIVLDVCFINHARIYEDFLKKCPHFLKGPENPRLVAAKFKWDILLLAAAIVPTAALLSIGDQNIKIISEVINRLLRCDPDIVDPLKQSIMDLATMKNENGNSECDSG